MRATCVNPNSFGIQVPYEEALAGIFVEGWLFVLLAVTGVRAAIIKLVPRSIMLATSSGIGLFLAFIGLQAQQGLGVSTYSDTTVVTLGERADGVNVWKCTRPQQEQLCSGSPPQGKLQCLLCPIAQALAPRGTSTPARCSTGRANRLLAATPGVGSIAGLAFLTGGCPAKYQAPTYVVRDPDAVCTIATNGTAVANLGFGAPTYKCLHGRMESATMWLGIAGFCITSIMMQRRIKVGPPEAAAAEHAASTAASFRHAPCPLHSCRRPRPQLLPPHASPGVHL